jgi:hypothetical protein
VKRQLFKYKSIGDILMKFVKIIIILLIFFHIAPAQWEIGLIGGLNRSALSGDKPPNASYKTITGPVFGVLIETQITNDVRIGLQPQYLQRGSKVAYKVRGERDPVDSLTFKIDYITIPLMFKVYANNKKTYLLSGLDLGFPLSAKIEDLNGSEKEDVLERLKAVDMTVSLGIGVRFPFSKFNMALELRYVQGLFNLNDPLPEEESPIDFAIRSTGIQLFTSISLPFGRIN